MMEADDSCKVLRKALLEENQDGLVNTLRGLIEKGTDVNSFNYNGYTILMIAAKRGYNECVKMLLQAGGANMNQSDLKEGTALMEAASNGHVGCVRLLLDAGANMNHPDGDSKTALLMVAAIRGYVECVRLLLETSGNVNQPDWEGGTVLIEAAAKGHIECVRVLLEAGANVNHPDGDSKTALIKVARRGYVKCMRLLLESGADVNQSGEGMETALMEAAGRGHVQCVQLLLEAGANVNDVDRRGETALMCCLTFYVQRTSQFKTIDRIEAKACLTLLINAGADIDAGNKNLQPICCALKIWPHFKFPGEYLISENCSLCQASYNQIQDCVYEVYLKEEDKLDILKLLFACGLPRHLCQNYIGEKETSIRNWVETVAFQPNTLKSICVFEIRKRLGHGIKSKVTKLNLPTVIQNLILM